MAWCLQVLVLLMVDYPSEQGTTLVWFTALLTVVISICLVLASSINQYLLAREITDYAEQFAVATKTLVNQGRNLQLSKENLLRATSSKFKNLDLVVKSVNFIDSKTVEVVVCANWRSPTPLVSVERFVCEKALSR